MDDLPDVVADVNARIREIADRSVERESEWEFMCECGDPACQVRVSLTVAEYEDLLDSGGHVLALGHEPHPGARAQRLRDEAKALRAQAAHQLARAKKNTPPRA
jgi:hypothetical protein